MKLLVDIAVNTHGKVPEEDDIRRWIAATITTRREEAEVSVKLVNEADMRELNRRYRHKNSSTNVLSFPVALPTGVAHPLLGDIVICPAVVEREADEQGKSSRQHWAHMLVHGSLHLLGYDHAGDSDAAIMESLETNILRSLGFPCPWRARESVTQGAPEQ